MSFSGDSNSPSPTILVDYILSGGIIARMKKKEKMLSQCCICKKVRRKEGYKYTHRTHMDEWGHHEKDLEELHKEFDVVLSHGLCEPCYDQHYKHQIKVIKSKS